MNKNARKRQLRRKARAFNIKAGDDRFISGLSKLKGNTGSDGIISKHQAKAQRGHPRFVRSQQYVAGERLSFAPFHTGPTWLRMGS